MTDPLRPPNDSADDPVLDAAVLDELSAVLGDASLWDEADNSDEDAIVAAIGAMVGDQTAPLIEVGSAHDQAALPQTTADSNVIPLSRARRWIGPMVAGVAAAIAVLVGASLFTGTDEPRGVELALTATDLAPDASGVVDIIDTPNGTRILLDVSGLPPAPPGSYYEAWVRKDAEVGVSAGTFHLRGGGGDIELWAGVTTSEYPLFTVTIQQEADVVSSGQVVLRGLLGE